MLNCVNVSSERKENDKVTTSLICPLLSATGDTEAKCQQGRCAWWVGNQGSCAIKVLASQLSSKTADKNGSFESAAKEDDVRIYYCEPAVFADRSMGGSDPQRAYHAQDDSTHEGQDASTDLEIP